mmetsp:Transcript_61816/g.100001  ORF Transcript_61816/g.100001 Transcript_61816/m.100001 type:complete len:210 (+) Transcript_61816:135-764(+)
MARRFLLIRMTETEEWTRDLFEFQQLTTNQVLCATSFSLTSFSPATLVTLATYLSTSPWATRRSLRPSARSRRSRTRLLTLRRPTVSSMRSRWPFRRARALGCLEPHRRVRAERPQCRWTRCLSLRWSVPPRHVRLWRSWGPWQKSMGFMVRAHSRDLPKASWSVTQLRGGFSTYCPIPLAPLPSGRASGCLPGMSRWCQISSSSAMWI